MAEQKFFSVGIFGKVSTGKSTLLNCLLHGDLLSDAPNEETCCLFVIRNFPDNIPTLYEIKTIQDLPKPDTFLKRG